MGAEVEFLPLADGRRLAYCRLAARPERAALPGVVFLGGLCSDMTGAKAVFLEAWAEETGHAFLRFDYTGHGQSSGRFEEGCVGDWARDAEDAIRRLTSGPQVLVGSSLGGWIALLLARDRRVDVAGLVGVAAAPDFTERMVREELTAAQLASLLDEGRALLPSEYDEPYVITGRLIADGARHLLLHDPLRVDCPVRLLHGAEDRDVPLDTALRTLDRLRGDDKQLTVLKGVDHRMSDPRSLQRIRQALDDVMPSVVPPEAAA